MFCVDTFVSTQCVRVHVAVDREIFVIKFSWLAQLMKMKHHENNVHVYGSGHQP